MFAKLFTVVLAATAASAATIPRQTSEPPVLAEWSVANFNHGCSPGGCIATYNLTAPAGYVSGAPGFSVFCTPVYLRDAWQECEPVVTDAPEGSRVEVIWEAGEERELIYVKAAHIWYQGLTRYNATADTAVEPTTTTFRLPVHSLTAVL